jgi:hypothetical protein
MKPAYRYRILLLLLAVVSLVLAYFAYPRSNIFDLMSFALKVCIIANCYTFVLIKDDMILGGWKRFIEQITYSLILGNKCSPQRHNLRNWILKPFISCEECISGQFALWSFLLLNRAEYNFLNHIFVIALCILLTTKIKYLFI